GADKVMLYASLSCLSLVALSVPIFLVAWMALPKDASSGLMIPIRLLLGLGISIVGLGVFTVGLAGMPIGWLFGKAYEGIKALKNRNMYTTSIDYETTSSMCSIVNHYTPTHQGQGRDI